MISFVSYDWKCITHLILHLTKYWASCLYKDTMEEHCIHFVNLSPAPHCQEQVKHMYSVYLHVPSMEMTKI